MAALFDHLPVYVQQPSHAKAPVDASLPLRTQDLVPSIWESRPRLQFTERGRGPRNIINGSGGNRGNVLPTVQSRNSVQCVEAGWLLVGMANSSRS